MSEASVETRFKFGNQAWKARSSHGRKPTFECSDALKSGCQDYFQWVDDNPLSTIELVKYQGTVTQVSVPKMRAMTVKGLCNYLDVSMTTWSAYRAKSDFVEVTDWAESVIYQQKFEGAAADMLNANIISRELGLADRKAIDHSSNLSIKQLLDEIDGTNTGLPPDESV